MSELKEYTPDVNGDMMEVECGGYYKIDEVDKVIAELESKLDLYKRGFKEDDKTIACLYAKLRHSNYKRCLVMAKRCKAGFYLSYECDFKREWWNKWHSRWLKLAEQFKEAK